MTLGDGGYFYLPTSQAGPVDVLVKSSHWLRRRTAGVPIGAYNDNFDVTLLNADIDDNNEVSIGDYAELSAGFGTFDGDFGWNPMADLNEDGSIDIGDYAILSQNYGLFGDD